MLKAGAQLSEIELFEWLKDRMPYFALPRYIEFRSSAAGQCGRSGAQVSTARRGCHRGYLGPRERRRQLGQAITLLAPSGFGRGHSGLFSVLGEFRF